MTDRSGPVRRASTTPSWAGDRARARAVELADAFLATPTLEAVRARVEALVAEADDDHDRRCLQLNPATNTMSPRAAALLASGVGMRPSLGHPGDKYEMGLAAIEEIETIAAHLGATVFGAEYCEIRLPSGSVANLAGFLALGRPGDAIIVPPAAIAGHVTHHLAGAAGLAGFEVHEAPIDPERYTVDVDGLDRLAEEIGPSIITLGGSLNLAHHPVADVRSIADDVGASLLFDAAHLSGPIAGGAWPNPLREGAHLMTMSTYKSLAGPPAGLAITDDAGVAEALDAVVHPGLTANFDAAKTAALAITLADWVDHGAEFATAMCDGAAALAVGLERRGVPLWSAAGRASRSHAFALDADALGGGHRLARHLERAGLLTSAIGTPAGPDAGLRVSPSELVRWGADADDLDDVAALLAEAIATDPDDVVALAPRATELRARFTEVRYCS